jgi:hypothetical protein
VKTFLALKALHEYRRRNLPFATTIEDLEVLREIGLNQASGRPLTLKALFLQGIGSAATIQRRLGRLKRLGVVHQNRAKHDRRILELRISPTIMNIYKRMGVVLRKALA